MPELMRDLAPALPSIHFDAAASVNVLESLSLILEADDLSGLSEWVMATSQAMPPALKARHRLFVRGFDIILNSVFPPMGDTIDSFPRYLDALAAQNPVVLRDGMLNYLLQNVPHHYPEQVAHLDRLPTAAELLADADAYSTYITTLMPDCAADVAMYRESHAYLAQPDMLPDSLVGHLREMWQAWMAPEWTRVEPMIRESAAAFEKVDLSGQSLPDVVRTVTNRDMRDWLDKKLHRASRIVFVPSAHIGPYIGAAMDPNQTLYLFFGARLPRTVAVGSSALSRAELLIRLNALADDTRLRILELLTQHDELCAQDIIERLDLSQSTISRHLSQLTATGYLKERRKDVAKCYSLNTNRVVDTVRALTNFMAKP